MDLNYEDTLRIWKEKSARLAFIYDFILSKYRRRINMFTLFAFLLTSMTSLLALSNVGLSENKYPELALALKVTSAVITTCAAIATGIPRLFGWSSLVEVCQKYLDSVEYFIAAILSEEVLPKEFRRNPEEFITQRRDQFLSILGNAPDISHSDFLEASRKYESSELRFRQNLLTI